MPTGRTIMQEVVKDLRSGKYKQGNGYLRKIQDEGPELCCVGVVCEVMLNHEFGIISRIQRKDISTYISDVNSSISFLPASAETLLNDGTLSSDVSGGNFYFYESQISSELLQKVNALLNEDEQIRYSTSLVNLNDNGVPFDVIADVIEEVWLKEGSDDRMEKSTA